MGTCLDLPLNERAELVDFSHRELEEVPLADIIWFGYRLKHLYLSKNLLTKLPPGFSNLTHLRHVDLSSNCLTEFPQELLVLPYLQQLDLSKNEISALPENLPRARRLISLLIGKNRIAQLPQCFLQGCITDIMPQLQCMFIEELYLDIATIPIQNRFVMHGAAFQRVPQLIIPGLFLGSKYASHNAVVLRSCGITNVFSFGPTPLTTVPHAVTHKHTELSSNGPIDLSNILTEVCPLVDTILDSGESVLMCCDHGLSLSPCVVAGYLIQSQRGGKWSHNTMDYLISKRYCVAPSADLMVQLEAMCSKSSATTNSLAT